MKKIISTTFLLGMLLSAGTFSAQKLTQEKMKAIYSDDVATFKKQFIQGDYNKCFVLGANSYSPLGFSVLSGKNNIVNFLLDNKANINKKCQNRSPLEIAESTKRDETAKLLIERGAKRD
ncbi:ankyrin repeat domain-containing protein [Chryseobacterium sp. Tr-659]|uniref:ankyrin repeat domain-containing protein n=1 Tax=Chryseobacterium sp. Tr-659 TaxID=2608340 RepID=UPI0014206719|nr:ankyrin repeat domain-containing protein [Chryseobacterium sp. Tr-659]NIF03855.1 ankyrin repeat domain-containing protein [Chryseobacterium sp. Tr-659]